MIPALLITLVLGFAPTQQVWGEDGLLMPKYMQILLAKHDATLRADALSPQQQREFLEERHIRELVSLYSKSLPMDPFRAEDHKTYVRRMTNYYKYNLIEIAIRRERVELDQLLRFNLQRVPGSEDEVAAHLQLLSQIFQFLLERALSFYDTDSESEAYEETALAFASLGVYTITEAYVRTALYQLTLPPPPSFHIPLPRFLRRTPAYDLIDTFWQDAPATRNNLSKGIRYLEQLTHKSFPELVGAYQHIFLLDKCEEILKRRINPDPASKQ